MKRLLVALVVALLLLAVPSAAEHKSPIPEGAEVITENSGFCPDGSMITLRVFDANPQDPQAPVFSAWFRGKLLVAVRRQDEDSIYVAAFERNVPLAELVQKYEGPCDLPFPGSE